LPRGDPTLVHGLLGLKPHPRIALALIELSVHPRMIEDLELAFGIALCRVAVSRDLSHPKEGPWKGLHYFGQIFDQIVSRFGWSTG